ncbi:MAG: RNA 3'-terminal phosphate cyclase [Candidatus Thermoplasmatota archaeon]
MLNIDGAHGEGGGQIVRTALAMSMITGEKIKLTDIRANRPNPGLSHQHVMAVRAAREICDAETEGVEKGSSKIVFDPEDVKGGGFEFDIGTAGSVTLLAQALLPAALPSGKRFSMVLKGGTDVKWSPPYDYFENVFLALLKKMGANISSKLVKRGHYPKGGGEMELNIEPGQLTSQETSQQTDAVKGRSFVTNLPEHIARRMKKEVLKEFLEQETSITIDSYSSASAGTGIVIWTIGKKIVGKGVLGEKGVPAEKVGREAAEGLKEEIQADVDLDVNAADQLIPYLAMIDDEGVLKVRKKTGHLETNVWVVNQFPGMDVELEEEDGIVKIIY